ncbi:MAG TPA: hypothetical protein VHV26_03920 [Rhizomicrobium sp.]|nr:hypothetical protein [Rhizomicrobium sp.]
MAALVADKAIEPGERDEIVQRREYRNDIAHQIQVFMADLSTRRFIREWRIKGRRYRICDNRYVGGGSRADVNADLAAGYGRVLV